MMTANLNLRQITEAILTPRFSNYEKPKFYYYEVDAKLKKSVSFDKGIPLHPGNPRSIIARNLFVKLILLTEKKELEPLILKHLKVLAENDINKEKEILIKMKDNINDFTSFNLLNLLSPITLIAWFYDMKEWKSHFDEFNRLVNNRLNYISDIIYESNSINKKELGQIEITNPALKVARLIHEFDQICRAEDIKYTTENFHIFRVEVAKLIKLEIEDPKFKNMIRDKSGNFLKIMKESRPENLLVMKGMHKILSR